MNEVALFESALRAAVPTRPDPRIEGDLVPRLAAVARTATLEAETRPGRRAAGGLAWGRSGSRRGLVARIAIAVAAVPLAFAGLAVAGVHLPQPARDAFDSVGIQLPNQPSEHSQAPHQGAGGGGNDVSGAAKSGPSSEQGNSAAAHEHAREQHGKAHGEALGHSQGKAIGLNEATPPGQLKEPGTPAQPQHTGPPEHSNAGGAQQSQQQSEAGSSNASGGGADRPLPPQANGRALGHSD